MCLETTFSGEATDAFKGLERELADPKPLPKVGTEPILPEQPEGGRKPIPVEIREAPRRSIELIFETASNTE